MSIKLDVNPSVVAEDDGLTSVTVTAAVVPNGVLGTAIDVNVTVAGSGNAEAVDFAPVPGFVITIPQNAGSATGTFFLMPTDDGLDEADEILTISGAATLAVTSAELTLSDDDPSPTVSLRAENSVSEAGTLNFSINLDEPSGREVRMKYRTENVNFIRQYGNRGSNNRLRFASPGVDFHRTSGSLAFSPGQTSKTVAVQVREDTVDEPLETVYLSIHDILNAKTVPGPVGNDSRCRPWDDCSPASCCDCGLIGDDDPSVEVVLDDARAPETSGSLTFNLQLSARTEKSVEFQVDTRDQTAEAGKDYKGVASGVYRFDSNALAGRLSVDLLDDNMEEPDETFELSISNSASQVIVKDGTAQGTIVDDDAVELSVFDARGREGHPLHFRVGASATSTRTVTVNYATTDGTAVAGQDYQAAQGTLTFRPGRPSFTTVPVSTLDNVLVEPARMFTFTLSSPTNATLDVASAEGTIINDDRGPQLSVAGASVAEGVAVDFVVSASATSVQTVTVNYGTADRNASAGQDYRAARGTLTFAPGETRRTVSVPTLDDALDEPAERFALNLSSAVNATVGVSSADGEIVDNDAGPALSVAGVSGDEGSALDFVVSASSMSGRTVTVNYGTTDGTALAGQDYQAAQGTLTFAPGETSRTVSVATVDDALDEPAERFALNLSSPVNATVAVASADGTIVDDDAPPQLSVAGASGDEGSALEFAVSASAASGQTIAVNYQTGDGAALAGEDYQAAQGTLTLAPGETSGTVTVATLDDALDEPAEAFALTLSSPANATLAAASAEGWILDDDAGPQLSVAGASGAEGSAVAFVVSAASTGGQTVTVDYATTDGTAVAGQDYLAARGSLDFAPGETRKTVSVATLDDALVEAAETFALTLSASSNVDFGARTATGTIIDNDAARVVLTATPASVPEGAGPTEVRVTAALEGARRDVATLVRVSVRGGSAEESVDFAAVPDFEIEIAAEAASGAGTFTLSPVDDDQEEADETLTVSGVSDVAVDAATLSLQDDDERPLETFRVLLFEAVSNPLRQGFLRVINNSPVSGTVVIEATDDSGDRREPVTLSIEPGHAAHFNSIDLEQGNPAKRLSGGVGASVRGDWRLKMSTSLDVDVLAYSRTKDTLSSTTNAFVTAMNEVAPTVGGTHRVAFFNPGANQAQKSILRLINTGLEDLDATISGIDDAGQASGTVQVSIPSLDTVTLTADELETGVAAGIVEGSLGRGTGKWRLTVSTGPALVAKALLLSLDKLTNLSSSRDVRTVPLFPPMSEPDWTGLLRVINRSPEPGEVTIVATDATGQEYEPLTLALGALAATQFISADLELGNPGRGLVGSTGAGHGDWRLELASPLDVHAVAYARSHDGFLTSIHDLVPQTNGVHRVNFFNPASNRTQVSWLHLLSDSDADTLVTITGRDDRGNSPGSPVRLRVSAGSAVMLPAPALESGEHDRIESGALGDGDGKWRLEVVSDQPVKVMSLLVSPTGHLSNVSTAIDPYGARRPESASGG